MVVVRDGGNERLCKVRWKGWLLVCKGVGGSGCLAEVIGKAWRREKAQGCGRWVAGLWDRMCSSVSGNLLYL